MGKKHAGGKQVCGVQAKPLKVVISGGWSKAEMLKTHKEHKPLQCLNFH